MKTTKAILASIAAALVAGCQEPKPKDFEADYEKDYIYCYNKIEKGPRAQEGKGLQFAFRKLAWRDECMMEDRGWPSISKIREVEDKWLRENHGPVIKP